MEQKLVTKFENNPIEKEENKTINSREKNWFEETPKFNKNKSQKTLTMTVLIAAYNEEKSIERCVKSCLRQSERPDEIIVVNDGSTDRTLEILRKIKGITVVDLKKNSGNKSKAQEQGVKYIGTDLFLTVDADSFLDRDFIKEIKKPFKSEKVSAVCGYVKSKKNNWITAVREINYGIGQVIYKRAQAYINAVFVLSGCCSAFRTKVFREIITFDHDNVTEDLDFTYKLKLAGKRIAFSTKAIVHTQDPNNLKSYIKQIDRWYSGGWVCLKKNKKILKKPNNTLVLGTIYLEGLIMGLPYILSPLLILFGLKYFFFFIALDFTMNFILITLSLQKTKRPSLIFYIPHNYFVRIIDNWILYYTFTKEMIFKRGNLVWNKPDRY